MITVFIDGACEPQNPGGYGACAFSAFQGTVGGGEKDVRPAPIKSAVKLLGNGPEMTNNVAEWRALKGTLIWLLNEFPTEHIDLFMDSQLVVYQFTGRWQCNAPALLKIKHECEVIRDKLPHMILTWIPRDKNWVADKLINDLYARNGIKVTVRHKKKPVLNQ